MGSSGPGGDRGGDAETDSAKGLCRVGCGHSFSPVPVVAALQSTVYTYSSRLLSTAHLATLLFQRIQPCCMSAPVDALVAATSLIHLCFQSLADVTRSLFALSSRHVFPASVHASRVICSPCARSSCGHACTARLCRQATLSTYSCRHILPLTLGSPSAPPSPVPVLRSLSPTRTATSRRRRAARRRRSTTRHRPCHSLPLPSSPYLCTLSLFSLLSTPAGRSALR